MEALKPSEGCIFPVLLIDLDKQKSTENLLSPITPHCIGWAQIRDKHIKNRRRKVCLIASLFWIGLGFSFVILSSV